MTIHCDRRLTPFDISRIIAFPRPRGSGRALAREYNVTPAFISQIRNRVRYREAVQTLDWTPWLEVKKSHRDYLSAAELSLIRRALYNHLTNLPTTQQDNARTTFYKFVGRAHTALVEIKPPAGATT